MSTKVVRLKYTGTAPGANSNVYTIFSTVATAAAGTGSVAGNYPAGLFDLANIHTFHLSLKHSQSLTIKMYRSNDGGTNWIQVYDSGSVAAPTYTTEVFQNVEGFRDFKCEVTNGGSAQATWDVHMDVSVYP